MSESSLSEGAQNALREAGWYPGRSIDISKFEERLNSLGYEVFPVVQEFLREFGDLVVVQSIVANKRVMATLRVHIKPLMKSFYYTADDPWISKYRKVLGRPICLVALFSYDTVLMDEAGTVYSGYDSLLQKLGHSGIDALENLLSGKPVPFYETWEV